MAAKALWHPATSSPPLKLGQLNVPSGAPRLVSVSRQEAEMMVRIVESIIDFARSFQLEFHSYCPMERWEPVLKKVGEGAASIEGQLEAGRDQIMVDADVVFAMTDLEECVSGSRDKRLESAKLALGISAAGAIGSVIFGLKWLAIPAYLVSLAIVLGKPLSERLKEEPAEPFRPETIERGLSGKCRLGDHTDKAKVIERVLVAARPAVQRHHWGEVRPGRSLTAATVCLKKGLFRVRCEGWADDVVTAAPGWEMSSSDECLTARNEIAVWEPAGELPRKTHFGAVPSSSGHEHTYWIEYVGPLTGGIMRRAGPFG